MANPVEISCPKGQWTAIAIKVTTGQIWVKDLSPNVYLQTYRDNGESPPTTEDEGVQIFVNTNNEIISADADIDIYIWPKGADGRVRVDLP